MPGRFNFQSPGAAAVDELTRVLAEREAKKRQDFLDSVMLKRENRADEIQHESLASLKDQRASVNAQRQQTMAVGVANLLKPAQKIDEATDKTLTEGNLGMMVKRSQDPLHQTLGPGLQETMSPTGQMGQQAAAPVITDREFTGTPPQVEGERKRTYLEALLKNPNLNADDRLAIQYQLGTGDNAPAGMFDKKGREAIVGSFEDYILQKYGERPTSDQVIQGRKDYALAGRDEGGGSGDRPYYLPQTQWDGQGRPVGTSSFDTRTGNLAAVTPPIAGTTLKPPNSGLAAQSILNEAALDSLDAIKRMYDVGAKEYIGPGEGWLRSLGQRIPGVKTNPIFANFKAATDALKNDTIRAITGAAVGVKEEARIMGQIPTENDKEDGVWLAKYEQSKLNLARLERRMRTDRDDPNAPPSATGAPQKRTLQNPTTGEKKTQTLADGKWIFD